MGKTVTGIKLVARVKLNKVLQVKGVIDTGSTEVLTLRGFIQADMSDLKAFPAALAKVDEVKAALEKLGEIQGDFKSTIGNAIMEDDGTVAKSADDADPAE